MKSIKAFLLLLVTVFYFTACEDDGEQMQVSGLESSELVASEADVVLSPDIAASIALALSWSESTLSLSNETMGLTDDVPVVTLEASASSTFDSYEAFLPNENLYAFYGAELNTVAKDLGFLADESTPMYFRIKMAYGSNTDPYYSNVVSVNVTCYSIDMSVGYILNSDQEDTGFTLYAPDSDGEYYGFTGNGSWANWYLLEGDGTVWGNVGEDGNEFILSDDAGSFWNFWYPGQGGCYYTTVSTNDQKWSATYIPSLTISGDVSAEMTFDKSTVKWYASITTTTANASITVSTDSAALYDVSTGTTDDNAIQKTLGFIANSDSTLSIDWDNTSATAISIAEAGEYTLSLYLADPTNWTYQLTSGSTVTPDPLGEFLYLPGVDDLISGAWTFDNYLRLLSDEDSTYAGVVQVESEWGYQMAIEYENWDDYYAQGDTEGTLVFQSATNITAPDSGLYLIEANLAELSYSHTELGDTIYLGGLNANEWTFDIKLAQTTAGVYSGTVEYTTTSSWGMKIYLIADDWDHYFGGSFDALVYGSSQNIADVQSLATGTYTVTVDLINQTCSFVAK